ncbi:ArsR/SmtB family transcription factor [Nonomuraea harbinensis]|uniref:ArsR/SmtB family transcription factor n=1 Tax=Nonomuraea harbinensis TaxID=1286938 RepID=A0ABW1BLJ4_9ACTN
MSRGVGEPDDPGGDLFGGAARPSGRVLSDGRERGWGELRAPVAKSTLSHHLKVLRDAGITRTRQEGTRCYVALRRTDLDRRFPGLLDAVLAAAEGEDVGDQVGLAGHR